MAQPAYLHYNNPVRPTATPIQRKSTASLRRSNLFRPPQPSPSTPDERRHSHTPSYASATATSRKRARPSSSHAPAVQTPASAAGSAWTIPSVESSIARSGFASPEPFVNTRYNLAGGLDTPRLAREGYFDQCEQDGYGVRRRWESGDAAESKQHSQGKKNVVTRYPSSPNSADIQSWGQLVFGVVGKVWQLGSSAFKGFSAGGGQSYVIPTETTGGDRSDDEEENMWESADRIRTRRDATPVPGSFPEDDDVEHEDAPRPAKRQHTDDPTSPWVMVSNPMDDESQHPRRTTLRASQLRPPSSSRRSLIPVSRRASSTLQSGSPAVQASYAHQRSSSDISPAVAGAKQSPLSPEAQRYLTEQRREQRHADASIRRLNEQLKAMIKEGKQALGTKVEVFEGGSMDMVYGV